LDDRRDEPWLEELLRPIAAHPNVIGAQLILDAPNTARRIEVGAGVAGDAGVDRFRAATGEVVMELAVTWASRPDSTQRDGVDSVWDDLAAAVARAEEQRRLQEQADTDELTGVGNRRRAIRNLAGALRRAERRGEAVAVLMLDLDQFKAVNDDLGHAAGDEVLRAFASMLAREAPSAEVARMGGEEFLVVLPGVGVLTAHREADRLRAMVPKACAPALPAGRRQTVSIGVSVFPAHAAFPDALIREADRALYEAKRSGRDQVMVAVGTGSDHPVRL
ncbi:MAG: GGDEF domain-containing protein, partial [Actinomycetota bacterium]